MATERGLRRRRTPSAAGTFALGVVAAVLAALVIPFGLLWDWKGSPQSQAFVHTPGFALWLLILAGEAAVWVGAAWLVVTTLSSRVRDLRRLRALPRGTAAAIVGSTVMLALAVTVLVYGPRYRIFYGFNLGHVPGGRNERDWPLTYHNFKLVSFVGIGVLIGFLAIAGMWLATVGLNDLALRARARASHIRRFVALRSELTQMLTVAGVLIGFAILATGALRTAVLATNDEPFYRPTTVTCLIGRVKKYEPNASSDRQSVSKKFDTYIAKYPGCKLAFDHQYVLGYGLLFSGLLAIAFAPGFLSIRKAGTRIRDKTYPLPLPSDPTFFQVVENRRKLDDLLQTNLSATGTFKAGVAIVTPLAASVISTLLSG